MVSKFHRGAIREKMLQGLGGGGVVEAIIIFKNIEKHLSEPIDA